MISTVYVCTAGETACYVLKNFSLEKILRLKEKMVRPFIDFAKFGKSISMAEAVFLGQTGKTQFSVTFDLDGGTVDYFDEQDGYSYLLDINS